MSSPHQVGVLDGNSVQEIPSSDGKKGLLLKSNALTIIWGGDKNRNRYWEKDNEGVKLVGVYWLEVNGKIRLDQLIPDTKYKLSFTIKLSDDASGWDVRPVHFKLRMPGKRAVTKQIKLDKYLHKGWVEVPDEGLEFKFDNKGSSSHLNFAMYEIENDEWKQGLLIKDVKITPIS